MECITIHISNSMRQIYKMSARPDSTQLNQFWKCSERRRLAKNWAIFSFQLSWVELGRALWIGLYLYVCSMSQSKTAYTLGLMDSVKNADLCCRHWYRNLVVVWRRSSTRTREWRCHYYIWYRGRKRYDGRRWRYKRCPMGLSNSPSHLVMLLSNLFSDKTRYHSCLCYMDD